MSAPCREPGAAHPRFRETPAAPASDAAPAFDDADVEAIFLHLQAMPPPIRQLATPENAVRFAAARLTGLTVPEILRAITASGLKLGRHAGTNSIRSGELDALANHVGSFLSNQTPLGVCPRPRIRSEQDLAAVERFVRRWIELYAKVEGTRYLVTDEDQEHAAEIVALVRQAAREHSSRTGVEGVQLEGRIVEHWIRAYLRDEGINGYLVKARHALRYLKRHVPTYGLPLLQEKPPGSPIPCVPLADAPLPQRTIATLGRDFLDKLSKA